MLLNYHGPSLVGVVKVAVPHLGQPTPITMYGLENCLIKNLLNGPHVGEFFTDGFRLKIGFACIPTSEAVVWKVTSSDGQM